MKQSKTDNAAIAQSRKANLIGVSAETLQRVEETAAIFKNSFIGRVKGRDVVEKLFELYSAEEIADLLKNKMGGSAV
jgi:hypothetical protein